MIAVVRVPLLACTQVERRTATGCTTVTIIKDVTGTMDDKVDVHQTTIQIHQTVMVMTTKTEINRKGTAAKAGARHQTQVIIIRHTIAAISGTLPNLSNLVNLTAVAVSKRS